jgi:membrane protease YdiL (CAAX protease family)
MTRASRFTLLWTLVAMALAAAAVPLTPPVYRALVDWGWIDPHATAGGDPFGKVLRRLLLVPIAVLVLAVFRPWRRSASPDMGLTGANARPRAGLTGFLGTVGVMLALLAVHVALGWLVVEVNEPAGRVGRRVVKTLLEALLVATIENWFFRAWLPHVATGWFGARWADPFAILLFGAVHAFRASNLDGPLTHDTAGAWEALKGWCATLFDPAAFGPAFFGLVLFGTLLTLAYRRSRTLWLPIGIHAAGIWVLLAYGAFTERVGQPAWAGTKALYDGIPGWVVLALAILWIRSWKPVPDAAPPAPPKTYTV